MTPDSLSQARALIEAPGLAAFSFDIFDTFLLRRCTAPDGVYERAFQLAPIPISHRSMVESFIQNRILAEQKARQQKWLSERKPEVTIDEIYAHYPVHSLGLSTDGRAALAAAEFAAELELCFANRDVYDLYEAARARGLRVGFISDTYWRRDQLESLLRQAAPDLVFDFLYSSCDFGLGKAVGLITHYLANERLEPAWAAHMGDNPVADVAVPTQLGLRTVHYPQASAALQAMFQQEAAAVQLVRAQRDGISRRLDGGLAVLRRLAAGSLSPGGELSSLVGAAVLGPVMVGFQRFIERRVAELQGEGRRVEVLFLARDGFLPFRMANGRWNYADINRRIALVGCSEGFEALQNIVRGAELLDDKFLRSFLKEDFPAVCEFIRQQPGGAISGAALADRLPELIGDEKMRELSRSMRARLLDYLRRTVVGFDSCTDLVLVDVGYFGTSQRALRGVFDRERLGKNIHGIYLMTVDYQFADLAEGDSVAGFIDDSILTPQGKLTVQRNVSLLEQFCSAPVGSVRNYEGGAVEREADLRPPEQLQLCGEIQDSCLNFARIYAAAAARLGADPLADVELARVWSAVILCRFLLMPSPSEQKAFGRIKHDVNPYTIAPMIEAAETEILLKTLSLPAVYALREPPMWLAASIAAVSPMAGYLYALSGFGLTTDGALGDLDLGTMEASLVKGQEGVKVPVNFALTGFRDIRIRIPVLQKHTDSVVALPLKGAMRHGAIRSLTMQGGADSLQASRSRSITALPIEGVSGIGAQVRGGHFLATESEAHVLVPVPSSGEKLSVLTMIVSPLPA